MNQKFVRSAIIASGVIMAVIMAKSYDTKSKERIIAKKETELLMKQSREKEQMIAFNAQQREKYATIKTDFKIPFITGMVFYSVDLVKGCQTEYDPRHFQSLVLRESRKAFKLKNAGLEQYILPVLVDIGEAPMHPSSDGRAGIMNTAYNSMAAVKKCQELWSKEIWNLVETIESGNNIEYSTAKDMAPTQRVCEVRKEWMDQFILHGEKYYKMNLTCTKPVYFCSDKGGLETTYKGKKKVVYRSCREMADEITREYEGKYGFKITGIQHFKSPESYMKYWKLPDRLDNVSVTSLKINENPPELYGYTIPY